MSRTRIILLCVGIALVWVFAIAANVVYIKWLRS